MTVRVQCPSCQTVCQVQKQHCGKQVKCGQCGQLFTVPPAPPDTPGAGLWAGLRGLFQAATSPRPAAPEEEEISLELDGPAAAALAARDKAAAQRVPVQGMAALPGIFRLDIGSATSAGRVRTRNEDSFLVQHLAWSNLDQRHETALLVVADGMGGYDAGDQASALVLRTLGTSLAGLFRDTPNVSAPEASAIDAALKEANRVVYQKGQTDAGCKGMGATAAVAVVRDGQVRIGHVGDCRVYHWHGDALTQVTRDQTLVARMVELGTLSADEARTHPKRNEVTQAVGKHADLRPAAYQLQLAPGDWLIVACDGLHAHVDDAALAQAIRTASPAAAALAHQLVDLANQGGGTDNCTVIALRCY